MTEPQDAPADRWRQLIGSLDPERNMRAAADLLSEAAASSERLLQSITDDSESGRGRSAMRDARADFERSFDAFVATAKRFLLEVPFRATANDTREHGARVAVLDGIGTTVVEIPGAAAEVRCGPLIRHDGLVLDDAAVRIVRSVVIDGETPSFVIRVEVPRGSANGVFHTQLVAQDLPSVAVPLRVVVMADDASMATET